MPLWVTLDPQTADQKRHSSPGGLASAFAHFPVRQLVWGAVGARSPWAPQRSLPARARSASATPSSSALWPRGVAELPEWHRAICSSGPLPTLFQPLRIFSFLAAPSPSGSDGRSMSPPETPPRLAAQTLPSSASPLPTARLSGNLT